MVFIKKQVAVLLIYLTILNVKCFVLIKTDEESEIENLPQNEGEVALQNGFQKQEGNRINLGNITDLVKIGTLLQVQEDRLNRNQTLQASKQDFYILKPHLKEVNNNSSKSIIKNELEKRIRENYSNLKKFEDEIININSSDLNIMKDEGKKNKQLSLHSPATQSLKIETPSKSYEITIRHQKNSNNDTNSSKIVNVFPYKFTHSSSNSTKINSNNSVPENQIPSNETNNKGNLFKFGNVSYLLTPISLNSKHNDESKKNINKSNQSSDTLKLSQSETNKVGRNVIPIRTKYNRNTQTLLTKLLKILKVTPKKTQTPIIIFRDPETNEKNVQNPRHDSKTFVDNAGNFIINQTLIPSYLIFKNNSTISFYPVRRNENINIARSKEFGRQLDENFSDSNLGNIPENEISSTVIQVSNGDNQMDGGEDITITNLNTAINDQIQKLETGQIIKNFSEVKNDEETSFAGSYNNDLNKELEHKTVENTEVSPTIVKGVLVSTSSNTQNSQNVDGGLTSSIILNDQDPENVKDDSEILVSPLIDSSMTDENGIINRREEVVLVGNSPNILMSNSSSSSNLNTESNIEIHEETSPSVVKGILVKTSSDILSSENVNDGSSVQLPQESVSEVTNSKLNLIKENGNENGNFEDTVQRDASFIQRDNRAEGVLLLADQNQSESVDDILKEPEKYTFMDDNLSSNANSPQMNLETIKFQEHSGGDVNIDLYMPKDASNVEHGLTEIHNPVESSIFPIFETEYSEGITKETEDNSDLEAEIIKEYLQQGLPPGMNFVFNEAKDIPEIILSNNFLTSKDKIQITTSKGHKIIIRAENEEQVKQTEENIEVAKEESQTTNTEMNKERVNLETSETGSLIEGYYDYAGHFVNEENAHLHVHDSDIPHYHTRDSEIYRNKGPLWWISTKDGFVPTGGIEATKGFVFKLKGDTSDSSSNQNAEAREAFFS